MFVLKYEASRSKSTKEKILFLYSKAANLKIMDLDEILLESSACKYDFSPL